MLKLLLISALLCTTIHAEWKVQTIRAANSFSVPIGHDIYTLSMVNHNTLKLFSSNQTFTPCDLVVNVSAPYAMRAKVLGNGKKIIAWQNLYEDKPKYNHTILLIDPWKCEYQSVPVPEDEPPEILSHGEIKVIAYNDSFDVFFPSRRVCWPCRFDGNAEKISLKHQIKREDRTLSSVFVEPLDGSTPERGYLYVHVLYENLTSVVTILDSDFKVSKQVFFDYAVNAAVTKYQNNEQTIVICHSTPDGSEVPGSYDADEPWQQVTRCDRLNTNLQTISSSRLNAPESHFVLQPPHVTLQLDARNNLHFGALMMSKKGGYNIVRYFGWDSEGKPVGMTRMRNPSLGRMSEWFVHCYLDGDSMTLIAEEIALCVGDQRNTEIVATFDVTKDV